MRGYMFSNYPADLNDPLSYTDEDGNFNENIPFGYDLDLMYCDDYLEAECPF